MIAYQIVQWHPNVCYPLSGYYADYNLACVVAERQAVLTAQEYRIVKVYIEPVLGGVFNGAENYTLTSNTPERAEYSSDDG